MSSGQEHSPSGIDRGSQPGAVKRGRPSLADAGQLSGRILDASWDVLLATGFENFTFDRLARHARIGKATIYSRFASKHELLSALLQRRIAQRRVAIEAHGADLPPVEAFTRRATEILEDLGTPAGLLLERLMDWLDQERDGPATRPSSGDVGYRARVYRYALDSIGNALRESAARHGLKIGDIELAAQFWLEGIIGHARLTDAQQRSDAASIRAWARAYSAFFFAAATQLPSEPS